MEIEVKSPFPFEALPRIWGWIEQFRHKVADDFSPQTLSAFVSAMAEKWDERKSWAVYADQELGGLITFEKLSPWLGTAHLVLKPGFQGRGIAVKACRLAVAEMFAEGIGKLAFYPLAGIKKPDCGGYRHANLAIGGLLIALGAKREGTLIGHTLCGGKPADMWMYGLSKGDFESHAIRNTGVGRSRSVDSRLAAVGEAKDQHQLVNADV